MLCVGFGVFVAFLWFCFLFCKCFGIPNSPRSLDLDDRQDLIASSAMQQKKVIVAGPAFFFALCCLGKIPGGAPFSQLHKSGNGGREDRP